MAETNIDIIVKMVDEATANLKKVQQEISGVSEEAEKSSDKVSGLGDSFKLATGASAAFAAGLLAIGAAAAGAFVFLIQSGREELKLQNELNSLLAAGASQFGFTADAVNSLATELANVTNFTDDEVLSAENMLLTFNKIGTETMPMATETLLNMATKMGGDVSGAAVQLGKALQDPINGISALSRTGISFSEDQKKVIERLVETGDVAGAQALILNAINSDNALANLARNTLDPITELKQRLGDFTDELGTRLLPYVNKVATAVIAWIDAQGGIGPILDGLISTVQNIVEWLEKYQVVIYIVAGAIAGALVPAVAALAVAIWSAAAPLIPFIAAGAAIGVVIWAIINGVKHWIDLFQTLWPTITAVWNSVVIAFTVAKDSVILVMTSIWDGIVATWNGIKMACEFFIAFLVGSVIAIFDWFGIDIIQVLQEVLDFYINGFIAWYNAFATFLSILSKVWTDMWNLISSVARKAWEAISAVFTWAVTTLTAIFAPWITTLKDMWTSMWQAVTGAATTAWEVAKGIVKEGINWIIGKVNALIAMINRVASAGASVLGLKNVFQIPQVPMLAKGGTIMSSGSAIVGEAGPELVNLPRGATVTPLGAGGITININYATVLNDEDIVEKIGNPIIQVLKQHMAIV